MAKRVTLTEEMKEKLRGIGIVSGTVWFTLPVEGVPEEFRPSFQLTMITVEEQLIATEEFLKDGVNGKAVRDQEDIARRHLVGWKNMLDLSTGEEVEFVADEDGGCSKELWQVIPSTVRVEIAKYLKSLQTRPAQKPDGDS